MKRYPKTSFALIVLILLGAYSHSWTYTPFGRLDYREAFSLHVMTFTYRHYKPDPNVDFEVPLTLNLLFMISDMLPAEEVGSVKDITIPGKDSTTPARVYRPKGVDGTQSLPVIVY